MCVCVFVFVEILEVSWGQEHRGANISVYSVVKRVPLIKRVQMTGKKYEIQKQIYSLLQKKSQGGETIKVKCQREK